MPAPADDRSDDAAAAGSGRRSAAPGSGAIRKKSAGTSAATAGGTKGANKAGRKKAAKNKTTKKKAGKKKAASKKPPAGKDQGPGRAGSSRRSSRGAGDRRATAVDSHRAALTGLDGRVVELEPGASYRLGRDEACDVVVYDSLVSRAHCRIAWDAQFGWLLEDLGSANGTRLEGELLTEPAVLADDDGIRIGGQEFRFHFLPPGVEAVVEAPDLRKRTVPMEDAAPAARPALSGRFVEHDLSQLCCYLALSRSSGRLRIVDATGERGEVVCVDGVPRQALYAGQAPGLPALRLLAQSELDAFVFDHDDGATTGLPLEPVDWQIHGSAEAVALAVFGPDAPTLDPADLQRAGAQQQHSLRRKAGLEELSLGIYYQGLCGISGDFYELGRLRDGRALVVLGDVAGHGVQAALLVAGLLSALRHLAPRCTDLCELVGALDGEIRDDLLPGQFCTAAFVALDRRDGSAEVLLAGHHPVRLCVPDRLPRECGRSGPGLGLQGLRIDPTMLQVETLQLPAAASLVLFSDPLLESTDADGHDFAEAGLEEGLIALAESADLQAGVEALAQRCIRFAGTVDDDLSILALRLASG